MRKWLKLRATACDSPSNPLTQFRVLGERGSDCHEERPDRTRLRGGGGCTDTVGVWVHKVGMGAARWGVSGFDCVRGCDRVRGCCLWEGVTDAVSLSHKESLSSRFIEVNPPTNLSTYLLLLRIQITS